MPRLVRSLPSRTALRAAVGATLLAGVAACQNPESVVGPTGLRPPRLDPNPGVVQSAPPRPVPAGRTP